MKAKCIYTLLAALILMVVGLPTLSMAQEITAVVTDAKGNIVKLSKVDTSKLSFGFADQDNRIIHISVSQIREVRQHKGDPFPLFEISLISGQILKGTLYEGEGAETTIKGEWEFGTYSLSLSNVRQVRFQQTQSTAGTSEWNPPPGFVAKVNDTVLHDLEYAFAHGACNTYWIPCKFYTEISTIRRLPVLRNSALYFIPFSKISQISPSEVVLTDNAKIQIQLYLKSKDADVFQEGNERWIVGETRTGRVQFPIKDIKSITFITEKYSPVKEKREYEEGRFILKSPFKGSVVTDSGASIDLNQFVFLTPTHHNDPYYNPYSYHAASMVEVSIGDASTTVYLSQLSSVKEFKLEGSGWDKRTSAKFVSKNGTLLSVTFKQPYVCVAGMVDFFYVKVCPPNLKSIDLK